MSDTRKMSDRRKNLVSNDPIGFIVLFRSNIDSIIAELKRQFYEKRSGYITNADIYQDILKEIKDTDHQPLFAKIDISYWLRADEPYHYQRNNVLYVDLDEIPETIQLFQDLKLQFNQNPLLKLIISKQDKYSKQIRYELSLINNQYEYIIYERPKDNPDKIYDFYKIYKNRDDLLDDKFRLISHDIHFESENNIIKYQQLKLGTPTLQLLYIPTPTPSPFYIPRLDSKETILINYNKMFNLNPVETGRYLMRNFEDVVRAAPLLYTEPQMVAYLSPAIASYLNEHPEGNKELYYYLGVIEYGRANKTDQDLMNILNYFILAGNFLDAKRYRELVFNNLNGLPFQTTYPFELNLDVETLVNLARFLVNKR